MTIGFTGTQKGMTPEQKDSVKQFLINTTETLIRHGCCIGADKDFHDLVRGTDPYIRIIGHPSNIKEKQADCDCDILLPESAPLERNKSIVRMTSVLIACPKGYKEELRSGTWMTIRYARKLHKPIIIIYPNGTIIEEQN